MSKALPRILIMAALTLPRIFTTSSCGLDKEIAKRVPNMMIPSESEMISALKQALEVGAGNASSFLNKPGGYLDNARFRIPFPPDAMRAADKLRQLGLGSQVDEFITRMNRGAEDAAMAAKPIFIDAIRTMTLTDARNIVLGADNAATNYFKSKTSTALYNAFAPKIDASLQKFNVTKYWTDITSAYNRIPGVSKVETDLLRYATNKALDGLFLKVQEEEKQIRDNVSARTTDVMRKVFSWADTQKK